MNLGSATNVLMRNDTANAMPIVIASSLLMGNLEPELGWLSFASSVDAVLLGLGEAGGGG